MEYHVFKKPKKLKTGKTVHRWYYYYVDETKKQVQRSCKGCKTRKEAEDYIRTLPDFNSLPGEQVLIKTIAEAMYIPHSAHWNRRKSLGKSTDIDTMLESRRMVEKISRDFGRTGIEKLTVKEVISGLMLEQKSGSWKNRYIQILGEVYMEAAWYGSTVVKPIFPTFARNSKKADIFTTEELTRLFKPENFPSEMLYLFFLLCLSGGLRLGEVRAVRRKQVFLDRKLIIIDGFCKRNGLRMPYNKKGSADHPRFRIALLPDMTLEKLGAFFKERSLQPEDFCFMYNEKPVRKEYAESVFHRALIKAGILNKPEPRGTREGLSSAPDGRKLVIHSLRYTYATRMRRELSADQVKEMLGHSSVEMTDYYTSKRLFEETVARLGGAAAESAANNLFI